VEQLQDVSNRITELVSAAPNQTMLGVHLGSALRGTFRDFQPFHYRCRNLREFIRMHVPALAEKGRSGQDVIYTITAEKAENAVQPQSAAVTPTTDGLLTQSGYDWKAYSNPGYPFLIGANRHSGMMRTFPQGTVPPEPWVIIPKPTSETHTEIAREFVSTLSEPCRTSLEAVLRDPKWYVRFSAAALRSGCSRQWQAFRRDKLIGLFNSSLRDLSIPTFPGAVRHTAMPVRKGIAHATVAPAPPLSEEARLRDLVRQVISELPLHDLRSLRLPVGVVFDVLKR
jgi:hypothetical protein